MAWLRVFTLTAAVLGCVPTVDAQIVNVLPSARGDDTGLSGSVHIGADWRSGNTELLLFRAGARGLYSNSRDMFLVLAQGEIGVKSGERFVARVFEHARYRRVAHGLWRVEAFVQHESDQFRRLSLRALLGVGARYERPLGGGGLVAIGSAYVAEQEQLREGDEPDAGDETLSHRSSSYIALELPFGRDAELVQTIFVQPRLSDLSDIRVLNETALRVPVAGTMSLRTSLTVSHDGAPPSGVSATDFALRSSLELGL